MTSFNSLLSSIGVEVQTPQPTPAIARKPSEHKGVDQRAAASRNAAAALTPSNAVAGVKRKADDSGRDSRSESANAKPHNLKSRPAGNAPLGTKTNAAAKPGEGLTRANGRPATASAQQKPIARPQSKLGATATSAAPANAAPSAPPVKRGYAFMMARAKAAQEAAQAAGPSGIKHKQKTVERVSNRDKQRLLEEQKAQKKAETRGGKGALPDRSKGAAPGTGKSLPGKKGPELSYKGTMTKAPEPLKYKGTMQAGNPAGAKAAAKKKAEPEGKYGGYASWSDLDEAEDDEEEEEGWDSEGSSDMEGGFDDMEQEEMRALRAARKEDQEALEEEERHRKEKLERKRKLEALSKSAAAKKRY